MKLKILIFLLVIPILSFSQEIKSGLSVGIFSAKWQGDLDQFANDLSNEMNQDGSISGFSFDGKSRVGFSIGIITDYQIKKEFSIQPEIYYFQKGTKLTGDGLVTVDDGYNNYYTFSAEEDLIIQTDYLDLLILAKYNLSKSNTKPYVIAGPGIGYLISSKMKVKVTIDGESDTNSDKYEGFKDLDAHFNVGGGIDFSNTIRVDVKYQMGLISILEEENSDGYKLRNGGLAFNLVAVF